MNPDHIHLQECYEFLKFVASLNNYPLSFFTGNLFSDENLKS